MRHILATEALASLYLEPPSLRYRVRQLALSPLRSLSQRALQLPSFLDKVLNPWRYRSSDVVSVEAMLLALEVATESYLGGPMTVADLAFPIPLSHSGRQFLNSPSSKTGFQNTLRIHIAGQAAAAANGISVCYDHPEHDRCNGPPLPQLVLTLEYS
jgi:hypothetical protein